MAYNDMWQMGFCIACGGPFEATRAVMLMDKIATRSMNFAEGHNLSEWGVQRNTEVKLVSPRQNLHTVQSLAISIREKNSLPMVEAFLVGQCMGPWGNQNAPAYTWARGALNNGNNVKHE
jgi:hypothetical protein